MIITIIARRASIDSPIGIIQFIHPAPLFDDPIIVKGVGPPRGDYGYRGKIDQRLGLGR